MKKRLLFASMSIVIMVLASSCTVNKKKKCNTCPKWTSEIDSTNATQRA